MRRICLSILIVALLMAALHRKSHAYAVEPPHCGFWGTIEAGLSCR
jgi:hypothetical protein